MTVYEFWYGNRYYVHFEHLDDIKWSRGQNPKFGDPASNRKRDVEAVLYRLCKSFKVNSMHEG